MKYKIINSLTGEKLDPVALINDLIERNKLFRLPLLFDNEFDDVKIIPNVSDNITNRYIFVVDTDSYSGNFEREMAAFLTGTDGDFFTESAVRIANQARRELDGEPFQDILSNAGEYCDHDPNAYVSIWDTPGYYNNGKGLHYRDEQEADELYLGRRWPAYQSIAIFFHEKPSDEQIGLLKKRAFLFEYVYKDLHGNNVTIEKVRLLKEITIIEQVI